MSATPRCFFVVCNALLVLWAGIATANSTQPQAVIDYHLGLAARAAGHAPEAVSLFKKACMAELGSKDACLAWAELALSQKDDHSARRALSSAVMLAPDDLRARFDFGLWLIDRADFNWACSQLEAAVTLAQDSSDRAKVLFALGYARFRQGDPLAASRAFEAARPLLDPELAQRCDAYLALIAEARGDRASSDELFERAVRGPDAAWAKAASDHLVAASAFAPPRGLFGAVSAAFGVNTYPSSSFIDDAATPQGAQTAPVLQGVLRGDVGFGLGSHAHGAQASATVYREQSLLELGGSGDHVFEPTDFDVTMFLGQAAYLGRFFTGNTESQLRLAALAEASFLDRLPETRADGSLGPSRAAFELFALAVGSEVGFSLAPSKDKVSSLRLRGELRPNRLDENRSAVRVRVRLRHQRAVLARRVELDLGIGLRYDRTYSDPDIVKYDRLVPEGSAEATWRTPWPRLSARIQGQFKWNAYLSSRGGKSNSFKPAYVNLTSLTAPENAKRESDYYDTTRQDGEWQGGAGLDLDLWARARLALHYAHQHRFSNIDSFDFKKDVTMLELSQGF